MNAGLKLCYEAFQRLKEGKPYKEQFKGLPQNKITASTVSQEAGFDSGYLKRSRIQHQPLISMIEAHVDDHKDTTMSKSAAIKKEKDKTRKAQESENALKEKLEASLGRELQLYHRLTEVEQELAELKQKVASNYTSCFPL